MYRKYLQFSTQYLKTCLPASNSTFLNINCNNHFPKRWAGHSKWQNIKNIKQANEAKKSVTIEGLRRVIMMAVKEGGPDLSTNSKLKALFEESKKANMSKTTFEKLVKAGVSQTAEKPYWAVFSGPKGIVVGFEVSFANNKTTFLATKFAGQTKKLKLKLEPHFSHLCSERGIIITAPLNVENAYEKAVEDAIEIGIDEVHESDDKSLIFECTADRTESYSQQLKKKGYNIESSSTELDFNDFVKLQDDEVSDIEKVISNLQNQYDEIIRACYNKAEQ